MSREGAILDEYEKHILDRLKTGSTQLDISNYLKEQNIEPHGLRSIEQRIKILKKRFKAKTLVSLIYVLTKGNHI